MEMHLICRIVGQRVQRRGLAHAAAEGDRAGAEDEPAFRKKVIGVDAHEHAGFLQHR